MPTNFYFQHGNTSGTAGEQNLLEDLIIESIQIYGHSVFYLPRVSQKQDSLLGEDVLSRFEEAIPIEMYVTNIQGWEGDGEIFSKFGLQVTHNATFVVSRRRWEDTVGASDLLQLVSRPAEGDLIFFPKTNSMFEIKFVQHLNPFYQLGKIYIYSMQCELYQHSSEEFVTGVEEIDTSDDKITQNMFSYQVLTQSGGVLLNSDGFSIIREEFGTEENVQFSDNEIIKQESRGILDFTIKNPFGEL